MMFIFRCTSLCVCQTGIDVHRTYKENVHSVFWTKIIRDTISSFITPGNPITRKERLFRFVRQLKRKESSLLLLQSILLPNSSDPVPFPQLVQLHTKGLGCLTQTKRLHIKKIYGPLIRYDYTPSLITVFVIMNCTKRRIYDV